jgi:ferric-dicitrate binding protein FerR (iron transport regulator)
MQARADAEPAVPVTEEEWGNMWNAIQSATFRKPQAKRFSIAWARAAAAVLVLATGTAVFFLVKQKRAGAPITVTAKKETLLHDVAPGGNKAVLTLADGSSIVLDSAHNGSLAQQGNTKILKVDAGQLSYKTGVAMPGQVLYNTIATPRGGQYEVTLADGTEVWLNAASSLRFPTAFTGSERDVELTGEAYFEVAKNPAMPFHVKVNKMDVQVLGTHFNIMAYSNEQSIKTTLLEGKVKVTGNGVEKNILPGQQAVLDNTSNSLQVKEANVDLAVAWKNGLFRFRETNIRELMRQVERWYDVEVEYKTQGSYQDYTGIVPRSQNVSALLQTLELTGTVHFTVEGKKITVLP